MLSTYMESVKPWCGYGSTSANDVTIDALKVAIKFEKC